MPKSLKTSSILIENLFFGVFSQNIHLKFSKSKNLLKLTKNILFSFLTGLLENYKMSDLN